jgi:hypothetical protein
MAVVASGRERAMRREISIFDYVQERFILTLISFLRKGELAIVRAGLIS